MKSRVVQNKTDNQLAKIKWWIRSPMGTDIDLLRCSRQHKTNKQRISELQTWHQTNKQAQEEKGENKDEHKREPTI